MDDGRLMAEDVDIRLPKCRGGEHLKHGEGKLQ